MIHVTPEVIGEVYAQDVFDCGPCRTFTLQWRTSDPDLILAYDATFDILLWQQMTPELRKFAFLHQMMLYVDRLDKHHQSKVINDIHDFANAYDWSAL